jgi:ATP-dependent DNA helicase RecG
MNAVMHRDYQSNAPIKFYWFNDRIEIHSPGGPYGIVTLDTMETTSDYRNPVIAEMMQALGYVNRYGYGIQQAQASLKANGNPPAEFTGNGNFVLAVIKKRPE